MIQSVPSVRQRQPSVVGAFVDADGSSMGYGVFFGPGEDHVAMPLTDSFSAHYAELCDGDYDCVDRIVLNGYFRFAQSAGGFRMWWRAWMG